MEEMRGLEGERVSEKMIGCERVGIRLWERVRENRGFYREKREVEELERLWRDKKDEEKENKKKQLVTVKWKGGNKPGD